MEYTDDLVALREQNPDLAAELAGFDGIRDVLDWMKARGLAQAAVDIVGQDEFHYDFLIRLGPADRWLAFGVT